LPREIVKVLKLRVDDYIDIRIQDNQVILEPQVVVPKDQAYFYTAEWQEDEAHAHRDIQEGRVTKTKNLKELFKKLDG